MVYCTVPGCEKINKGHSKRFMFSFPKKEELLLKWLEALPNLKRPVKSSWRVCQHHFENEDILNAFSHTIGGEVYLIERERPRLKPNVVPSKNLQNKVAITESRKMKSKKKFVTLKEQSRKRYTVKKRPVEQVNILDNDEVKSNDSGEVSYIRKMVEVIQVETSAEKNLGSVPLSKLSDALHETTEKSDSGGKKKSVCNVDKTSANDCSNQSDVEGKCDENNSNDNLVLACTHNPNSSTLMEADSFELFDSVFEVILPTTLWGVHRSPQQKRIMFVCIDEDQLNINKMLTVDDTGDLKIYIATHLIREEHYPTDDLTPEHITDMLAEIDAMQICFGANLYENCEVVLTAVDNEGQRQRRLCRKCY